MTPTTPTTRLNYARIVPMVDFTAQSLSRLIR